MNWHTVGIEALHEDERPAWGVFTCGQDETPECQGVFFEREMADSFAAAYWPHLKPGECDVFEVILTDRGVYAANGRRDHGALRAFVVEARGDSEQ